jgi:hypothetical protein
LVRRLKACGALCLPRMSAPARPALFRREHATADGNALLRQRRASPKPTSSCTTSTGRRWAISISTRSRTGARCRRTVRGGHLRFGLARSVRATFAHA